MSLSFLIQELHFWEFIPKKPWRIDKTQRCSLHLLCIEQDEGKGRKDQPMRKCFNKTYVAIKT